MSQRVSIYDLWDDLQRDPSYTDWDSVQELVDRILAEISAPPPTFKPNPQLVAIGLATNPVFKLILILCGLCGLNTYRPDEKRPTGWSGQKFADRCHLDLQVDLDELERVLLKHKLPLLKAWLPEDEKPSTSDQLIARELVSRAENAFCRGEGVWLLKYKGELTNINDLEGLLYITHLIRRSGEKILSSDLVALVKGRRFESPPYEEEMSLSTLDLDLTVEETKRIENMGHEILEDLKKATDREDHEWIERAEQKFNQYRKHLLDEYAIKVFRSDKYSLYFRKIHRRSVEQEKARHIVKNRITYAYKKIGKDIPALENYLRLHIKFKKGSWCYEPDPENPLDWHISL